MTQKKRSSQLLLLRDSKKAAVRFRNSIFAWWERRGNRPIKFESLNVFLFISAFFLIFWSIFAFPITGELVYLLILQRSSAEVSIYGVYFVELLALLLTVSFLLLYLRRVKQCTFRQLAVHRATWLKWDSRSKYLQWIFVVGYLLLFLTSFGYSAIAPFLSQSSPAQSVVAFSMSFCVAVMTIAMAAAFFMYLMFSLGMRDNEKAAYCLDYLTKTDEVRYSIPAQRFSREVNYVCEDSIKRLGKLMLFDRFIGDELDLGPALCNVFLGLFWGDNEEKKQTSRFLRRARDMLLLHQQGLACRLIVRSLMDYCDRTRDLCTIRDTLSLNISPVKRVTTLRKLSENSVMVTILGVCIAVISFIIARIFPS